MGTARRLLRGAACAITFALAAGTASAQSPMPVGGISTQPVGHYEFCRSLPEACAPVRAHAPVELTRELWAQIVEINNHVNRSVIPRTDMELWGREEVWSFPVRNYGDCEDYALEKQRLLNAIGVPLSNLAITVVRQPNGDGHAVLTVSTHLGDFILDNLEPRVLDWTETEYRYLKRQSPKHMGMWVSIHDDRNILVGSVRD